MRSRRGPGSPPLSGPGLLPLLSAAFFLTGIVTVVLGPLIPELEELWQVEHDEIASLFVAQFAASSLGSVLSGFHLRRSLAGGHAATAAGLTLLALGGRGMSWLALGLVGFGLGLVIPATNLWVAHAAAGRRGAALARMNLVWGLGAVSCPLLFALFLGRWPVIAALWLLAALSALFAGALGAVARHSPVDPVAPTPAPASSGSAANPPSTAALLLLAGMFFLYVGVENAVGGWLVVLGDQIAGERSVVSLLVGSGFWAGLLAGRAAAPLLLRRLSESALYAASLAVASGGALLLAVAATQRAVAAGAVLAGLGLAALFPLTVSLLAERTAATRSRASGWVFAFGGLGGALLPWLTGLLAGPAGAPATEASRGPEGALVGLDLAASDLAAPDLATAGLGRGLLVPLAGLALLALLFVAQRWGGSPRPAAGSRGRV